MGTTMRRVTFSANTVSLEAPWIWLAAGWRDLWTTPGYSLGYGLLFVGGGLSISWGLYAAGLSSMIPAAAGGFALIAPVLAIGLYEISRRIERREPMVLADILVPKLSSSRIQIWFFSFFLLFAFLVWTRVAMLVFALFTAGDYVPLDHFMKSLISEPSYVAMAVVGSLIGGGIAFIIFAVSVIAVPMLLDRDVDAFTAMGRSLMAVRENFRPMLLWAWLIAVFVLIGFLTLTLGMIILFPLLGHASWHCYRQVASAP